MAKESPDILSEVAGYYSGKLAAHGATPQGVDWNGQESQDLRFEQLTRVIREKEGFSLNDLGCGYGALLEFARRRFGPIEYTGCDVSADMVEAGRRRFGDGPGVRFACGAEPPGAADYGIASGVFNVRLGRGDAEWREHLEATLDTLDRTSRKGFAFNCLTSYSDREKMRDNLYYADPCRLFDLCKQRYSRNVALLHDYGLYEFSILVRKSP